MSKINKVIKLKEFIAVLQEIADRDPFAPDAEVNTYLRRVSDGCYESDHNFVHSAVYCAQLNQVNVLLQTYMGYLYPEKYPEDSADE
jgi:hypothetical protein